MACFIHLLASLVNVSIDGDSGTVSAIYFCSITIGIADTFTQKVTEAVSALLFSRQLIMPTGLVKN